MDENLEFDVAAALRDGGDLLDGEFTREDNTREAKLPERENAFEIVRDKLGRGMKLKAREMIVNELRDAEVLHDHAIRADVLQPRQRLDRRIEAVLVEQRVEGDINLLRTRPECRAPPVAYGRSALRILPAPRIRKEPFKFLKGEVRREGTRRKVGKTAIDRVRARFEGGEGRLEIARRRKKFNTHDSDTELKYARIDN